MKKYGIDMQKV